MIRWIDTRDTLPPQKLKVLIYVRDNLNGKFEDYITSARCHYDIETHTWEDGTKHYHTGLPIWGLDNVKGHNLVESAINNKSFLEKKDVEKEEIDNTEWGQIEVTHWTLIPEYTASEWIDIEKYPPPENLNVLVYMKDSCEDKDDFITEVNLSCKPVNNSVHKNNPGKYFYKPVCWTLYPPTPKMIDDTFV